ncbi:MAG: glycosyltransferase [Deferrisomatales bacterium]
MTVLHLDAGRTWRGGQQQVYLLHRELTRRGVDSRLLARGELLERCRGEGLAAARLPGRGGWTPGGLAAVLGASRGAAILHAHDSHALGLAAVVRTVRPGLRLIGHRRVSYPLSGGAFSRWKYQSADAWVAVSAEIARVLARGGVPAGSISVVHSAVDLAALRAAASRADLGFLRAELDLPEGAPVVGFCGAFSPQKGHRLLAEAARSVRDRIPDALFLLPGEGDLLPEVRARTEALGLAAAFRFPGFRRDVAAVTALFTIAAVPSVDGEGSSAALKEPMALGVPVVASDLEGNVEVLGRAGAVFPRGDAAALARVLARLLGNAEERARLAQGGRERVRAFDPAGMAEGILAAYRTAARRAEGGERP